MNRAINNLPFELHIPSYSYCGPGTKLQKRLNRGDPGINKLDEACKNHDIAYAENKDIRKRNIADKILSEEAWKRVQAKDSSFAEKAVAYTVSNIMKAKSNLGMGLKQKIKKKKNKTSLNKVIRAAKKSMKTIGYDGNTALVTALQGAKNMIKKSGGKNNITTPKIIRIPKKIGGVIPLIPIFAGLSALGALAGGVSGIAKAVNDVKSANKQLQESKRHNKKMESIAVGKGLYLAPYQDGSGVYLTPDPLRMGGTLKKKNEKYKKKKR